MSYNDDPNKTSTQLHASAIDVARQCLWRSFSDCFYCHFYIFYFVLAHQIIFRFTPDSQVLLIEVGGGGAVRPVRNGRCGDAADIYTRRARSSPDWF